jgi:hypothetical protein
VEGGLEPVFEDVVAGSAVEGWLGGVTYSSWGESANQPTGEGGVKAGEFGGGGPAGFVWDLGSVRY